VSLDTTAYTRRVEAKKKNMSVGPLLAKAQKKILPCPVMMG
jgi:hypothetical protein